MILYNNNNNNSECSRIEWEMGETIPSIDLNKEYK